MSTSATTESSTPLIATSSQASTGRVFVSCLWVWLAAFGPSSLSAGPAWLVLLMVPVFLVRFSFSPMEIGIGLVVCRLVAMLLGGVAYELGTLLLDGPASDAFRWAINAPFLALLGLEYYEVAGGVLLALVFAPISTFLVRRFTSVDDPQRGALRTLGFIPILLSAGALWFMQSAAAQSILTVQTSNALGRMNGATADVIGVDLDLTEGRLSITDISLANPRELTRNLFHGLELTANISTTDLLRKRVHIEQLIIRRAETDVERKVPGVLIGEAPPAEVTAPAPGEKTIEDYLQDWEQWQARLAQAREWIEKLSEDESSPEGQSTSGTSVPQIAAHLIDDVPSLLVSEVLIEGMTFDWLDGENLSLSLHNLSTNPGLVDAPIQLSMGTSSDLFELSFGMPTATDPGQLRFALRGIPMDAVAKMLKLDAGTSLGGGTLDLEMDGPWRGGRAGYIDMPLLAKLHDINLAIGGSKGFAISELSLPIHLSGPIDRPSVRIDPSSIQDALKQAGAQELANFVDAKKADLIDRGRTELDGALDKLNDKIGTDINLDAVLDGELTPEAITDGLKQEAIDQAQLETDRLKAEAAAKLGELTGGKLGGESDLTKEGLKDSAKQLEADAKAKLKAEADKLKKDALKKLFGGGR